MTTAAATTYLWEWQKPRPGIRVDKTPAADLVDLTLDRDFFAWVRRTFAPLPGFICQRLTARINRIHATKGRPVAELALRDIIRRELPQISLVNQQYAVAINDAAESADAPLFHQSDPDPLYHTFPVLRDLVGRFNRLPNFSQESIDRLSHDIAVYMRSVLSETDRDVAPLDDALYMARIYREAASPAKLFSVTPPSWNKFCRGKFSLDDLVGDIHRLLDERWWYRRLKTYAARWREHLHIALGDVKRGAAPYCSRHCAEAWDAGRKRTRKILSGLMLEDQDTGERISLIEQVDRSISSPALRRVELMTRIGGFERIATEAGYSGQFFTLTAPSAWHAYAVYGHRNARWSGASPAATQRYLNRIWTQIRAELARRDLYVFGLRVAEPHHDGTPHWHGLLFCHPERASELRDVMESYATREDAQELCGKHGRRPRFEMKPIDATTGSATGYVVKYISKNIDGYALDGETDDECGTPLKETAKHATAWASCWGIRQFQFLGCTPVSVWRELRRMRSQDMADRLNPLFADLHRAADAGDWAAYVRLQGGAFVSRKDLALRIWYQQKGEPNGYGEYRRVIKGLTMPLSRLPPVETRLRSWRIVRMNPGESNPGESDHASQVVDLAVDKGASAPSGTWTCVNNCTEVKKYTKNGLNSPPPPEPEQLEMGHLTHDEKTPAAASLQSHKPGAKKSPADELDALAYAITAGYCTDYALREAESWLKIAREIRQREKLITPAVEALATEIQTWARIKKAHISRPQAIRLALGEAVTVLDTVWRAHPVTGELVVAGAFLPWRKTLAKHRSDTLVSRWKVAAGQ